MSVPVLVAVILAGGGGSRLWPLSRRSLPKQCLALAGDKTLLQQTVDRLVPLIDSDHVFVVTGRDMEAAVRRQVPQLPQDQILVEPQGRNTAPCIGWAAVEVERKFGQEAVMVVLPADQMVTDPPALHAALSVAAAACRQAGALVTLGIQPDRPATGFGYLEVGPPAGGAAHPSVRRVNRFVEKPDAATATQFLAQGSHLWNAGIFVFTARAIRSAFSRHLPATSGALDRIRANPDALADAWPDTDATSIDFGVMERSDHILTVPCDIGWSDLGAWDDVGLLWPEVPGGRGRARRVVAVNSEGCLVHALDKAVALVGLQGVVVVDTPDALLVVDRRHAQEVRAALKQLQDLGETSLL